MKEDEVVRRRLAGQFLTGQRARTASEVVRALIAVQAQEYQAAKWALGLRTVDARDVDVESELTRGTIVRTHVLRPTWHFVAAQDIRWLLALSGPRVHAANASRYRRLEIDDACARKTHKLIARAFANEKFLTRAQLRDVLERAGMEVKRDNRLAHMLMRAELDGLICSGPRSGKQFTYALLDQRVAPAEPIERDEALQRLATAYFSTRGPASAQDFSWWSGLTITDTKRAIAIAGDALENITVNDRPYWYGSASKRGAGLDSTAHLLPIYDEYFIGLRDRSAITRRLAKAKKQIRADVLGMSFVFVDGQIAARWQTGAEKGVLTVRIEPLTPIKSKERARVNAEVERFGNFYDQAVRLSWPRLAADER